MKKANILLAILYLSANLFAACPSMDFTENCYVDFEDYEILASLWLSTYGNIDLITMASQWLTAGTPEPDITWITINDSGAGMKDSSGNPISHGGFIGEMSKYETTNSQYCQFLNDALVTGDITVNGDNVLGADGSNDGDDFVGTIYYFLSGSGNTSFGVINGGASRIHYNGVSFFVENGLEDHPVTYVSWYGATAFCNYYGYRLPTEWEWQAVADYDGSFIYGCGLIINDSMANYFENWQEEHYLFPHGTTGVGTFGAYGYGMCDMAGNVYELTSSFSNDRAIIKGGCWVYYDEIMCRVTSTRVTISVAMDFIAGFRVCR